MWHLTCTNEVSITVQLLVCLNRFYVAARRVGLCLALSLCAALVPLESTVAQSFFDPLDTPAQQYPGAVARLPIQAMTRAGSSLLAVGLRGVILRSDDEGKHWSQVSAPVSSDLLDVFFASPSHGWVVGQDGVILASVDGGASWHKQFDGRQALAQFSQYYQADTVLESSARDGYLQMIETNFTAGPVLPFFAVRFIDERNGLAVGPFGILVASEDGGEHWHPALQQIDNPDFLHLNVIAQIGAELFITSEQGVIFKADAEQRQFRRIDTGHQGSFFSISGHDDVLLAGGLAGVLYASHDSGETWARLNTPLTQLVTRITYDPAEQRFLAVTAGGEALALAADLSRYAPLGAKAPMLYTDVAGLPGGTLFAGIQGLRQEASAGGKAQRGEH
jgi:photosystem II stability/assembly factor-like uncharacterized protein